MKSIIVIDVGNTSTKWAIADRNRIPKEHEFPTARFTEIRGRKLPRLNLPDHPCGAIIACVSPRALPGIRACLRSLGINRPLVVTPRLDLGIRLRYPAPNRIGADRLVNAAAAAQLYGMPAVVVDFGTAVTFDVISARGEYLGGAIAPGVSAMTDYLHEHTALLPKITIREPASPIGKSTEEAMRVGAVIGYRGLIEAILEAVCRQLGRRKVHIIATGGHCRLIAAGIPRIQAIDPWLTLNGLRLLYARNVRKD